MENFRLIRFSFRSFQKVGPHCMVLFLFFGKWIALILFFLSYLNAYGFTKADPLPVVSVEGQPLAANIERVEQAFDALGAPMPMDLKVLLSKARNARDGAQIQKILDPRVLLVVQINPESRVKVSRGPSPATIQQGGYHPVLVKIINESSATQRLRIGSPQSGPVYSGVARLSMERQRQMHLRENENTQNRSDRFLDLEMVTTPPLTGNLSGLGVEYAIALIYSSEMGRREATISFDIGQGSQDLGFRAETPVLFDISPAVKVKLSVKDVDGTPTLGRFLFLDRHGHVFPPQAKRLAPDFFFQKQIYRADGETVLLPPGELTLFFGRGPEYRWVKRKVVIPLPKTADEKENPVEISVKLDRWINPRDFGFISGDHHIHAAGCAHYTSPTEGVKPEHMFRQVKGEGLNVGSVLTWGPCFDHQQAYFAPGVHPLSEPFTLLKYDIEVSGFGSQAHGHVCLLNLREQIYPGANGSQGWPNWTVPVLRWAKSQGGYTGYAHSGSGLGIDPVAATRRMFQKLDANKDGKLDRMEAAKGLMPEPFDIIDSVRDGSLIERGDGFLTEGELIASHDRVADHLPNLAIPELNGVGAQEIFVTTPLGLCDFISAMDTERLSEWNCWYHLLNCGFPLAVSGETDFPCMSSTRVGQGRVYVQMGKVGRVDFSQWCEGMARGRGYVSDGYAHALAFSVQGKTSGEEFKLEHPGPVKVRATVGFCSETPLEVPYGGTMPVGGRRNLGDTRIIHEVRGEGVFHGGTRLVELVVNGRVVKSQEVPADDKPHELEWDVTVNQSSWIALRHFPQLHTNPVRVIVGKKPVRASRESALWAIGCVEQLWTVRASKLPLAERIEAKKTYDLVRETYGRIAAEALAGR